MADRSRQLSLAAALGEDDEATPDEPLPRLRVVLVQAVDDALLPGLEQERLAEVVALSVDEFCSIQAQTAGPNVGGSFGLGEREARVLAFGPEAIAEAPFQLVEGAVPLGDRDPEALARRGGPSSSSRRSICPRA